MCHIEMRKLLQLSLLTMVAGMWRIPCSMSDGNAGLQVCSGCSHLHKHIPSKLTPCSNSFSLLTFSLSFTSRFLSICPSFTPALCTICTFCTPPLLLPGMYQEVLIASVSYKCEVVLACIQSFSRSSLSYSEMITFPYYRINLRMLCTWIFSPE